MNKKWAYFTGTFTALVSLIYISGYGYIFKAILTNFKRGSLTPSNDDGEKFPAHPVTNQHAQGFAKDGGCNPTELSAYLLKDLKRTGTSSLVMIRNNKIVVERYWKDHQAFIPQNSFSMAKGILAMLVGCAIDDGYITSEDQLISEFLPAYKDSTYGKYLTFKHLLTMQAGMDWDEEYHHPFAPNAKQYFVDDLSEQTLSVEVKEMPGKKYEYQSVSTQLLGLTLKAAIGKDLADYLSERIWKPLGMEFPAKWSTDEKGLEKAFCCIHASPVDFAKIGQLILQDGNWNGRQIISKSYIQRMLTPTNENDAFCYSVWADDDHNLKHRFFYGFLGQFIIMVPEKNMVIVKTGLSDDLKVDDKLRPCQVRLLIDELKDLT
ncbi:serine hydrolase domain-containing protein [Epilithonimonas lactis]|uniref:serine hydrolase domain-containing protein n=1 Tax=Epilithonimonas lactis TaxID=421072 RepID=UPI00068F8A07|nr:serine hydrolase [Epilithonimonas lactis]